MMDLGWFAVPFVMLVLNLTHVAGAISKINQLKARPASLRKETYDADLARMSSDALTSGILIVGRLAMILLAPSLKDQELNIIKYPWWRWGVFSIWFVIAAVMCLMVKGAEETDDMTKGILYTDVTAFILQFGYYA